MQVTNPVWRSQVTHARKEAMRTIRNIRAGDVNEADLDMLQNFVQFALALMLMEGEKKWGIAKVNAELMNYMKE